MLSIITISYNDIRGLTRTIDSIKSQEVYPALGATFEHVIVASGLSQTECKALLSMCSRGGVQLVLNSDSGLYNAMNIGRSLASGTHILYMNGGDQFFEKSSLRKILENLKLGHVALFRVSQCYQDLCYFRPGLTLRSRNKSYSHQGFVAPIGKSTPWYDESKIINADTFWIKECLSIYPSEEYPDVIAKFELGGISNRPRMKTILVRFETNGLASAAKEAIKLVIYNAIGAKRYYQTMAWHAGFDRSNKQ